MKKIIPNNIMDLILIFILLLVIIFLISYLKNQQFFIVGGSEKSPILLVYMKKGQIANIISTLKKECPKCKVIKINSANDIKKYKDYYKAPVSIVSEGTNVDAVRTYQRDNPLDLKGIVFINPVCVASDLDNYNPQNIIVHTQNPSAQQERCFHHIIRDTSSESIVDSIIEILPK